MRRTMTAGQWSAFSRSTDSLTRRVMPAINRLDPKPVAKPASVAMNRVALTATRRNDIGRIWSF